MTPTCSQIFRKIVLGFWQHQYSDKTQPGPQSLGKGAALNDNLREDAGIEFV